ncbi:putative membrane protein [Candidatus Methanoperedens nitroreducens]|uniref:Putative membrane protein n=1 Tax=Candidatus Methanoperedens nitratireducens TaxID=1392998 RepID=A0A062VAQ1_9EURY|nr:DUF1616 domain-containing protein [Candidatus Methanoperedens nitroreducens]KCZ72809.1 putative membrane protein [Candidatus Methanoperedens nitroreducens]MDJ1423261.1 DUF1616 domain-containing protein [Candidatus Methanoperedens sp.]
MISKLLLDLLNNSSHGLVDAVRSGTRSRLPSDLKAVVALTVLTLVFVLLSPFDTTEGRIVLGLLMVLFLPGYALIASLFPGKNDLESIERTALSFGMSIAVVPLIGLALNFTPWGIRPVPVIVSLTVFTLVMASIAHARRLRLHENMRFEVHFKEIYNNIKTEVFVNPESRTDRILTIILIASIIASLLMVVYVIVTPKQGERFTEFYILGLSGKAEAYPTNLTAGKADSVIVGIANHEYEPVDYTLQVRIENDMLNELQVQMEHNQTWEQAVSFTPMRTGTGLKLQFLLYKNNNLSLPYRDVHLWVNIRD